MKKFVISLLAVVAVAFSSGCSGVTQNEYDSLTEENSQLKATNESLLNEKNDLVKEYEALKAEKEELEQSNNSNINNNSPDDFDYCFDIQTWMLGRPQSTIVKNEVSKYTDDVNLETTYYWENSELTVKMVHTIKDTLSSNLTAIHIYSYEKAASEDMEELLDDKLKEYVIIYRNANGSIIGSSFYYIDDSDNKMNRLFVFTKYAESKGIVEEIQKLNG